MTREFVEYIRTLTTKKLSKLSRTGSTVSSKIIVVPLKTRVGSSSRHTVYAKINMQELSLKLRFT